MLTSFPRAAAVAFVTVMVASLFYHGFPVFFAQSASAFGDERVEPNLSGSLNHESKQGFFRLTDFATGPIQGNGAVDDGPMWRAAIAACMSHGYHRLYVPQPQNYYSIQTLDASGLGGIVLGNGAAIDASCEIEGEAERQATMTVDGAVTGGVRLILGDRLNRPLLFIRRNTPSPVISRLWLDGNGSKQTGWPAGPATPAGHNGGLYTIQIEDDSSAEQVESSIQINESVINGGFNGNIYVGAWRGLLKMSNSWSQFSGQSNSDASIFIMAFDTILFNMQIGGNKGVGLYYAQGTQHQIFGGALFYNHVAEYIAPAVQAIYHSNVAYTNNYSNAIQSFAQVAEGSKNNASRIWVGGQFTNNSAGPDSNAKAVGMYSDILASGSLSLTSVDFNSNNESMRPKYHLECLTTCKFLVINPHWIPGQTSIAGFTNAPQSIVTYAPGRLGVGTDAPTTDVDVVGEIRANGYYIGTSRGASCNGPPTSAFEVVNGIIVHC